VPRAAFPFGTHTATFPAAPPHEALAARRDHATDAQRGEHVHKVPKAKKTKGYLPG
jgi:hypothetical protein